MFTSIAFTPFNVSIFIVLLNPFFVIFNCLNKSKALWFHPLSDYLKGFTIRQIGIVDIERYKKILQVIPAGF